MNLFDINTELMESFDLAIDTETGEILDEVAMQRIDELTMQKDEKVLGIAKWIKNLEVDAKALKEQKQIFAERQAAVERKIESLKRYLTNAVSGEKFEDAQVKVGWRKSETVNIVDEQLFVLWAEQCHDELLKFSEPSINKTAVKDAIKSGEEVRYAEIVEK